MFFYIGACFIFLSIYMFIKSTKAKATEYNHARILQEATRRKLSTRSYSDDDVVTGRPKKNANMYKHHPY